MGPPVPDAPRDAVVVEVADAGGTSGRDDVGEAALRSGLSLRGALGGVVMPTAREGEAAADDIGGSIGADPAVSFGSTMKVVSAGNWLSGTRLDRNARGLQGDFGPSLTAASLCAGA